MRHLMTSFLAIHWAAFFALLAYLCIDAGSIEAASAVLGSGTVHGTVPVDMAVAPAAVAFLLVAALFCWLFAEACFGRAGLSDGVVKIAFVAGGAVLSALLLGRIVEGAGGPPFLAAYLAALVASYVAVLGEYRTVSPESEEATATVRFAAREAAHVSLLGYISNRPQPGKGR